MNYSPLVASYEVLLLATALSWMLLLFIATFLACSTVLVFVMLLPPSLMDTLLVFSTIDLLLLFMILWKKHQNSKGILKIQN